jgi:hypothetical protein
MRTIETTVYKFNELSSEAQEKAIDNCRYFAVDSGWWDRVYEQVTQAAQILGIEIDRKKGDQPAIYFSGFGHQGQGSSFEGYYSHAKGCVGLTSQDIEDILRVIGKRCSTQTKHRLEEKLQDLPSLYSVNRFSRLAVNAAGRWEFTAVQSYPHEIRYLREEILR